MIDNPISTLLYGGPGVGKTATAVSSFYDWKRGTLHGNGKLITFGREHNPALRVPIECRTMGKNSASPHFSSPKMDDFGWIARFEAACDGLLVAARKGNCLDALVVDGMSELDLLYETVFQNKEGTGDKFAKWDALLNQMFSAMQRLDPVELGCDVFVTARVMEKKRARKSAGSTIPGDPDYIDFDYYPSLRGSFRLHFPHYFNLVLYMEAPERRVTAGEFKGRTMQVHIVNMLRNGGFYVKTQWDYKWLKDGLPTQLFNPDWPDVKEMINTLQGGGTGALPTGSTEVELDVLDMTEEDGNEISS